MIERIRKIMELKQMSIAEFADKINVGRSNMTHIFNGRNQPSLEFAKKILTAFPDISTEWLIMGMGEMLQPVVEHKKPAAKVVAESKDAPRQTELFDAAEDQEQLPGEPSTPMVTTVDPSPDHAETAIPEQQASPQDAAPKVEKQVTAVSKPVAVTNVTSEPEAAIAESTSISPKSRRPSESHNSVKDSKRDRISNSQGDKKLVKIVFFYDDRTFEEYFPA